MLPNAALPHTTLSRQIIEILTHGPLSLANLQVTTQVSMPTLRRAVHELLEGNWLSTTEQTTTSRGRPAMLFGLDQQTHLIIGAHLQLPGLRLVTVNLTGQVLDEASVNGQESLCPDVVIQEIAQYTSRARQAFRGRQILGTGIASPGFTDLQTGEIISIGRVAGWQNFPMRSRIRAAVGLEATLVNDVDCMAYAEILNAGTRMADSLIYVGFDEGIKASIFLNGVLYTGPFGNAGNIGRTRVTTPGKGYSSLEDVASIHAIVDRFHQLVEQAGANTRAHYGHILCSNNTRQQFDYILEAAQDESDGFCRTVVADMLDLLALSIANVIYVIQPESLIVGGALSNLSPALFFSLETGIRQHLPPLLSNQLVIQKAQLASPNSVPIGIVRQFLRYFITTADFNLVLADSSGTP